MNIQQQLEMVAESLAKVERIPCNTAEKMLDLLDRANQEALQMLVDRKVKFLWMPAKRRLVENFGVK